MAGRPTVAVQCAYPRTSLPSPSYESPAAQRVPASTAGPSHRYTTPGTSGYISAKVFGDPLPRVVLGTQSARGAVCRFRVDQWAVLPQPFAARRGRMCSSSAAATRAVIASVRRRTLARCCDAQRVCSAARDNTACLSVAAQRSTAHVASGCHWSITARWRVTARHAANIQSP
jgi:hypothetical protein